MNDTRSDNTSTFQLLPNQMRLWLLSQQDRDNPAYNIQLAYHLKGAVDVDLFNRSLSILFDRQKTIFSAFRLRNGEPVAEIVPYPVRPELLDFSASPASELHEQIISFMGDDSRKPFDIEEGPLFRLYLIKAADDDFYFYATVHHLVFDGWSRRIFALELSSIYTSLARGKDPEATLASLAISPSLLQENNRHSDDEVKAAMAFWKESLHDCQGELKFPYDFPRRGVSSGIGFREPFEVSPETVAGLRSLSESSGASMFNVILSAMSLLLKRYSGDSDICIGVPVSARHKSKTLGNVFGLFVSTSVVRLQVGDEKSFMDHVSYTRDVTRSVIRNSFIPFEKIVAELKPERVTGANPYFQVSLSWLNGMTIPMDLNGVTGEKICVSKGVSPFDISFYVWEDGEIVKGEIEFNADLLKRETVIRLKNNFTTLLRNLSLSPEVPLGNVPFVSPDEQEMLMSINQTKTRYPSDKSIIQIFEEYVRSNPDSEAVVCRKERLTYRQLNEKAHQVAHRLTSLGVKKNDPVTLMADKSAELIIGVLGILKAGGCYVPIDPEYPDMRTEYILADSGSKVFLTQEGYMNRAFEGVRNVCIGDALSGDDSQQFTNAVVQPADAAYIMYTSGTTGNPKGTPIPHRGVVRLVKDTNYISIRPDDHILMAGAIVFDATTFEIWAALLNGATLHIADKETILNPQLLGDMLRESGITVLLLTSSLFTQISNARSDIFGSLSYLLVGGDVLSAHHINKVRRVSPGLKIINAYGPTENSCISTFFPVETDAPNNVPIGRPISNSTAYIFDRNMNFLPVGVIGELYVGGDGLTDGYLNREDLNKDCFMENPYIRGERIYKTGDLARFLPDLNIEFHGRIDNQLKIRGFRVELEEIESVISEIDGVVETVILPMKVERGDYRLYAFLNVNELYENETKDISGLLKSKLPSYMLPYAFKLMNGFPKTINGKIDRVALMAYISEMEPDRIISKETLTDTEKVIKDIWCETLKVSDVSVYDNFFDIGGNSLLAIPIMSKIEGHYKIKMGLRVFFDSPRIKDIAESVDLKMNNFAGVKSADKTTKGSFNSIDGEI